MENNTAKHFVLQLGSLITLYLSIAFLLVLLFGIINLLYPDAVENYWQVESASNSVRLGIAMLIVFFPTYLILTRKVNQNRRKETNHTYLGLTKWLIYLSLLIGGGVLLGDMVAIILSFLNGELTTRFILKAGVLLVIVGSAFYYYLQDARGYWLEREKASVYYALGMSFIVLVSLIVGFSYTETPAEVREMKLDETQVRDLENIQWRIEDYVRLNEELPESLLAVYVEGNLPTAPENRDAYEYKLTETGFELCATFAYANNSRGLNEFSIAKPVYLDETAIIKNPYNWDHGAGRVCFERVVNLEVIAE